MTEPVAQNLVTRLSVVDVHSLQDIFSPMADLLSETVGGYADSPSSLTRENIGAIISVEPDRLAPGQRCEAWRLPTEHTHGVNRHHTALFYTQEARPECLRDLFINERNEERLRTRAVALAETLRFADDFLKSSASDKLIVHCIRGIHRSPVLMTAIVGHQLAGENGATVIDTVLKVCEKPAQLRMGELAFVDAFLGRGGNLINAWDQKKIHEKFNAALALEAYEHFLPIVAPMGAGVTAAPSAPCPVKGGIASPRPAPRP